jgi:hypothetical protein
MPTSDKLEEALAYAARLPKYAWAEYDLACFDALSGKSSLAFHHLEQALDLGLNDGPHVLSEPDVNSLKKDPRWKPTADPLKALP